jgi:hypothetical protein
MKANELRIGNWVMVFPVKHPQQVCDVMFDSVNTDSVFGQHYGEVDPIPFTEDWLLRFGFKKFETSDISGHDIIEPNEKTIYYEKGRFTIVQWGMNTPLFFSSHHLRVQIQHVHQLQNLYFALTGEELIKTDKK